MQFSPNSLLPRNVGGGLPRLDRKVETEQHLIRPRLARPQPCGQAAGRQLGEDLEKEAENLPPLPTGCAGDVTESARTGLSLDICF